MFLRWLRWVKIWARCPNMGPLAIKFHSNIVGESAVSSGSSHPRLADLNLYLIEARNIAPPRNFPFAIQLLIKEVHKRICPVNISGGYNFVSPMLITTIKFPIDHNQIPKCCSISVANNFKLIRSNVGSEM